MTSHDDPWARILAAAIANGVQRTEGPVPGAVLRTLVAAIATTEGLAYPPEDEPELRFAEFLDRYPQVAVVLRRQAQDILVAPADAPQLLLAKPVKAGTSSPGIRRDLFEAFTLISQFRALYNIEKDEVEWVRSHADLSTDGRTRIPAATLESSLQDRVQFAETEVKDPATRNKLLEALHNPEKPLSQFTELLRAHGLQPTWHRYRTKLVADRIANWARETGISWRDDWLTADPAGQGSTVEEPTQQSVEMAREWRRSLTHFAQSLDREDLARISVPLDIVLKALQHR